MNAITRRKLLAAAHTDELHVPWWATLTLALAALASVVGALGLGVVYALFSGYVADYVPIEQRLAQYHVGVTTVYDRGGPEAGVVLGTLPNPDGQLLTPVPLDNISPFMLEATVSTEDNTFWTNPGIEAQSLVRAAYENYSGGGIGSGTGGSTITQQLVKNVYLSDNCVEVEGRQTCTAPRTLGRKLKELAFSVEVEQHYTKDQILTWYLNQVSYADRYVGVEAAAEGYFHKSAADLSLAEAATLAGIPAAPTAYHPRLNCAHGEDNVCTVDDQGRTTLAGDAKARQEHVLNLMVEHGRATADEVAAAINEPVLVYPAANPVRAAAFIDNQVEPRLVRMCEAGILPKMAGAPSCTASVHNAGYRVTSSLDYAETEKAQAMMNQYLAAGLAAGCECHDSAIVTIDPTTGQVMVYVPNLDSTWTSDRRVAGDIDQANEINQPGSSFKPAVYLTWFDKLQKTPMSSLWDTSPMKIDDPNVTDANKVTILNPRPGNGGEGLITARAALGGSQNVGAFRAAQEAGVDNVLTTARHLGITTLAQGFDPTFYDHSAIYYGPSVATGGANIRAIDMAYMNATIANMGTMVGVPTLAETLDPKDALSLKNAKGDNYDRALEQRQEFLRGDLRLPDTRELDPVTVLEVRDIDGNVLYTEGPDLEKKVVVEPAATWMLVSIQTDCTARFIIWTCGNSNDDLSLDAFMGGVKIPEGIKTGTQQGFLDANDTLETWMNGYSRYAATSVWVGNADNSLVHDGARYGYASANATIRLFKNWMGQYHADLRDKGVFVTPKGFEDLQPSYVALQPFQSATTERGRSGGCSQMIPTWVRTDLVYKGDCQGKGFMPLPDFQKKDAIALAYSKGIPIGPGYAAPSVSSSPQASPSPRTSQVATGPTVAVATQPPKPTPAPAATTTPPPAATPPPKPKDSPPPKTPAAPPGTTAPAN